jgi:glutaminyl-tRNA synthetase
VKGIIHWVNAKDAKDVEVRLYDRLWKEENPMALDNFMDAFNNDSLQVVNAKLEPYLAEASIGDQFQFERTGYFTVDSKLSTQDKLVYNRTVTLKDSWAKQKK